MTTAWAIRRSRAEIRNHRRRTVACSPSIPEACARTRSAGCSRFIRTSASSRTWLTAIGDVPEDATAFSNRQYLLWLNFAMAWNDPANDSEFIERTRKIVRDLGPWVGRGVYVNMLNFDELDRVVEAFGGPDKYARLGRVKARYDPGNLFQMNYNITPAPR